MNRALETAYRPVEVSMMSDSIGKAIVGGLVLLSGSILFGSGIVASAAQHDNFGAIPMVAGVVLGLVGLLVLFVGLGSGGPPAGK
jgi:hypothetical protein